MQRHFDEDLAEFAAGPGAPSQANQTQAAHVELTDSMEILIHNMLDHAARRRLHIAAERAPAAVAALPASAQPVVSPDGERIRILEAQLEAQADRIHQLEAEATRMLQIASQLQEMQEAHRHRRQRT
eukprot:gene797-1111_t